MTVVASFGDPRLPERFWNLVSPCPITGCWWWSGKVDAGRPSFTYETKRWFPRRLAYDTLIDRSTSRRNLSAVCGAQECCNPNHARTGAPCSDGATLRRRESARVYYRENKERQRWRLFARKYGVSRDEVEGMLAQQGGKCASCCRALGDWFSKDHPCIDHCHATGVVRGILCTRCNIGVGFFGDSPRLLRAAADYLIKHGAKDS